MKMFRNSPIAKPGPSLSRRLIPVLLLPVSLGIAVNGAYAASPNEQDLSQRIQQLSNAMANTQAQVDQSQRQLEEMRRQLNELKRQMEQQGGTAESTPVPSSSSSTDSSSSVGTPEELASAVRDIREHQTVVESQIATHDQIKIESESKYPVKVTGMLLLNGFVNSDAVDMAATPTVAVSGSGNIGASVRQTILGIDARGPHLFGASSFADLRVDFAGTPSLNTGTSYAGSYNSSSALLRLRTAHAGLQWDHAEAFFSLDHPIVSPETPTSLTAVAEPALAWSGNLWTWNPQAGITADLGRSGSRNIQLQAALIDTGDAPLSPVTSPAGASTTVPASDAEQSFGPGVEARFALLGSGRDDERSHIGFGGYFAPHTSTLGRNFDSWAGTLDTRLLLFAGLQLSGSFYRGLGLGGLGGGAYKDFAYRPNPNTGGYYFRALDDVGGWTQLKEKLSERLEFNGAYGMDNVFSGEMRHYIVTNGTMFQNLTINRTFTGNVIYSPSAYLLFSLEYRYLKSSPIAGLPAHSNIIGIGAGYRF